MKKVTILLFFFVVFSVPVLSQENDRTNKDKFAAGYNDGIAARYWINNKIGIEESVYYYYSDYNANTILTKRTSSAIKTTLIDTLKKTEYANFNLNIFYTVQNDKLEVGNATGYGSAYRLGINPEIELFIPKIIPNLSLSIGFQIYDESFSKYPYGSTGYNQNYSILTEDTNALVMKGWDISNIGIRYYFK